MTDGSNTTVSTTVSRRSTRYFAEDQCTVESGNLESRHSSTSGDERDREKPQREAKTSSTNIDMGRIPMVNLGKDLGGLFPKTSEDLGKQVTKSLQAAMESTKAKVDGRPLNFGTVIPGQIYRSSFPMVEDFQFLGTLGLKTIVSLVNKEFSPDFLAFMRTNGIRHCIIEMQGTKKVEISEAVMNSIMEVVLDKENHPLLIHCNHGKHRTGCAVAVIRHIAGWNVNQIVEEYQGHAAPKIRDCDVKYITDYDVTTLEGLFIRKKPSQAAIIAHTKRGRFIVAAAVALSIWLTTFMMWEKRL